MHAEAEVNPATAIDWTRLGILINVEGLAPSTATISFTAVELKILRLLLTRELGGEVPAFVNPNLGKLLRVVAHMEQFAVERERRLAGR